MSCMLYNVRLRPSTAGRLQFPFMTIPLACVLMYVTCAEAAYIDDNSR